MHTRNPFRLSLFLLLITICSTSAVYSAETTRPNIVFYLTDDMRHDAMGCAGNAIVQTPHLDRLASQGVRFTNMFCTTSICAVSRATYLTGQYGSRHNVGDFATPLPEKAFKDTFPALLRKSGYYTGFVGKWGLGGPLPEKEFDSWAGYSGQGKYFPDDGPVHLTDQITEQALAFIKQAPRDKPFLLCISTKAPHAQDSAKQQFQPAKRFVNLYDDVAIPLPVSANEAAFEALPPFLKTSEGRIRWQRRFANEEMRQASVKDYYRLVTGVDESVGKLRDAIEKANRWTNTAVVFTSDNGFYLGEHGLAGKWFMHEESIRLPLIICLPGAKPATPDPLVLSIDIAPTILDLANITPPKSMQGKSVLPLMTASTGDAKAWRDAFFYEHHYEHKGRIPRTEGVRKKDWKYVRYIDSEPLYEELFDLPNDPQELHNLATDARHNKMLAQMRVLWSDLSKAAK